MRLAAGLFLVVAIVFVINPSLLADPEPPDDGCVTECVEIEWVVAHNLACLKYNPKDCGVCNPDQARCVKPKEHDPFKSCVPQGKDAQGKYKQIDVILYESGSCAPKCNLYKDRWSEAKASTGKKLGETNADWHVCKRIDEPDPDPGSN
jgi:hypothetical protein